MCIIRSSSRLDDLPLLWASHTPLPPLFSSLFSLLAGWLNAYKEGGWLPSWASPGYRNCMVHSVSSCEVVCCHALCVSWQQFGCALPSAAYYSSRFFLFDSAIPRPLRSHFTIHILTIAAGWHICRCGCGGRHREGCQGLRPQHRQGSHLERCKDSVVQCNVVLCHIV